LVPRSESGSLGDVMKHTGSANTKKEVYKRWANSLQRAIRCGRKVDKT